MSVVKISNSQVKHIQNGLYDDAHMLSAEAIESIASKINKKIDVPFVREGTEKIILVRTVRAIDRCLNRVLPKDIYQLVLVASDGISDSDAQWIEDSIVAWLNKEIDIPYVPEWIEEKVINIASGILVRAMRHGERIEYVM